MIVAGGEWLTLPAASAFYEALIYYGDEGAWEPVDMLTLMAGECDLIRLDRPNAHGYQGPTQIGARELRNLGWKDEWGAFCRAPAAVQVEYAARYFAEWRKRLRIERWTSAGHLWACNLAPAHLAREDGVVYDQLTHPKQVAANRWLDRNRDGVITRDELTEALLRVAVPRCRARYDLALASLAEVRGEPPAAPPREYTPNVQPAASVVRLRGGAPPPDTPPEKPPPDAA